ncbi:conserved hypothetical protein [Hyella patelloides LEGE 07179]|uniref:DUF924 domain-containing protein n=1 Tax=Hyella patelloides LEGE 07179 TaxID=945734 RepID=A0A563VU94_9CYAN|nr:DUF924 family protein [Hyella patelloides]VEP14975.1 conserved hypothetical protein [Hyella patelloides LEGE 07179]
MNYQAVLDFWFGKPENADYGKPRKFWFIKSLDTDAKITSRFETTYQAAARGELDRWRTSPLSCLALIIVLDQFPRNLYRGKPQSFGTDGMALEIANYALEKNYDRQLLPVQRWFIYLPVEHSEDLADQKKSVKFFSSLKEDYHSKSTIDYAQKHLAIIQRFGRFPHRNEILDRKSTSEEIEFLKQPGSRF